MYAIPPLETTIGVRHGFTATDGVIEAGSRPYHTFLLDRTLRAGAHGCDALRPVRAAERPRMVPTPSVGTREKTAARGRAG